MKHTTRLVAVAALCGTAFGQTGLTTIQDALFKADGTRFNGAITIRWSTFDVASAGTIVQQSRTVRVSNGNLQVQLAPNAGAPSPANTYTVDYQSDGREQFTELWTVPAAVQPLRVADVRTGMLTPISSGVFGTQTPIAEAGVIGLVADLAQRPVKGAGFGNGNVAVINQNGQIETVVGSVGDCVYADGTAGPCGGQSSFFDAETPGGLVDGTNAAFTLANQPTGSSLMLFRNGLYMKANFDYTLNGSTLHFAPGAVPQPLDTLVANYRVDRVVSTGTAGNGVVVAGNTAQVLCSTNGASNNQSAMTSLGSCDIPPASLKPGDRIELRFVFSHTGTVSGFDAQVNWGGTTLLARHGGAQDVALAGQSDAAITASGAQITSQSWGTVLAFLPGILNAPLQNGVKVDFRAAISRPGNDSIALTSYAVLRYPGP